MSIELQTFYTMKKICYILLMGLLPFISQGQTVILDHESPGTTNPFTYFGNCTLDATNTGILANPDASGINTSATVGSFTKTGCALTFAGCFGNPAPATPVDLTTDNRVRLKVWMDHVGSVSLKLENSSNGGANWIGTQAVNDINQWVEVEFNMTLPSLEAPFTAAAPFTYNQVVLFFDFGAPGTGVDVTSYFDDLVTDFEFSLAQINLPITWDDPAVDYTTTDFGGNVSSIDVDPFDAGNAILSVTKTGGAELWAGTTLSTTAGLASPIAIDDANTRMSARVLSPDAGIPVRLKIEDKSDPTRSVETEAVTTVAGAWEVLIFDFANEAPGTAALNVSYTFNMASMFFNFGTTGAVAGEKTYLLDDVVFIGGGGTGSALIDLPITWDDPAVDYTTTDFGGNVSSLAADPLDAGNTILSVTKTGSAELWAGTTLSTPAGLASAIAINNSNTRISARVLSPDAGIPVRMKIEDKNDPTRSVETEAVTTVAGAWEVLIFDFANEAPGTAALNISYTFNMASIFFNFGTTGAVAGEKTYLLDDVVFIGGGGTGIVLIDLPITFDEPGVDYTLTDFEGNATVLVADPVNPSNTVARSTKGPGAQFFAGTTMSTTAGFANPIPVTFTESTMSMRVYSPDAGIVIRLKIEDATDPTRSVETDVINTVANGWETLVFDFNNEVPGTAVLNPSYSFTKASVFFNFGVTGDDAGEKSYFWDDVYFGLPDPACSNAAAPTGLSANVSSAGAALSWNPIAGSVGCVVEGGKVGSVPTRIKLAGSELSSANIPAARLEAGSSYNWRVACGCDANPSSVTPWSAVDVFSVPALRESNISLTNPASTVLNMNMLSSADAESVIRMVDLSGRTAAEWFVNLSKGNNSLSFDISKISNGMYLLHISGSDTSEPRMVLIQH